jgi:hypothetical protein
VFCATLVASEPSVPLQIECACGHRGTVPDEYVGKEIQCPRCKKLLIPLTQDKMENFAARVLFAAQAHKDEAAEQIIPAEAVGPEISFTCPFCSETYQVSAELAGKKISCRNCRQPFKVDELDNEPHLPEKRGKRKRRGAWVWIVVALLFLAIGILLGRLTRF